MKVGRKRRPTGLRLLAVALAATVLFILLALGENYAETWLRQRRAAAKKEAEMVAVKETIVDYNRKLAVAYRNRQAIILTDLVTPDELRRIDLYITYNYGKGRILLADLSDIRVDKVAIEKKQATAKTREQWIYKYVSADKNARIVIPSTKAGYRVDYKLVKAGKHWIVSSVKPRRI